MKSLPVFLTAALTLRAASLLYLSARPAYAGLGMTTASIEADWAQAMKGQLAGEVRGGLLRAGDHGRKRNRGS